MLAFSLKPGAYQTGVPNDTTPDQSGRRPRATRGWAPVPRRFRVQPHEPDAPVRQPHRFRLRLCTDGERAQLIRSLPELFSAGKRYPAPGTIRPS
jgi:hypothetical protein